MIAGPTIAPLNTLDSLGKRSILKVHIIFLSFLSSLGSILKVQSIFLFPFLLRILNFNSAVRSVGTEGKGSEATQLEQSLKTKTINIINY